MIRILCQTGAPLLGLSLFFTIGYASATAIPPITDDTPLLSVLDFTMLGVLCGIFATLVTPRVLRQTAWLTTIVTLALGLGGVITSAAVSQNLLPLSGYFTSAFISGLLFPAMLRQLMREAHYPGLMLGVALALGNGLWVFLLLTLQNLDGGLLTWLLAPFALFASMAQLHKPTTVKPSSPFPGMQIRLGAIVLVSALLFVFSTLLDILFYREQLVDFSLINPVQMIVWIGYPLAGFLFDRRTVQTTAILITILLLALITSVAIGQTEINVLVAYRMIYALELTIHSGIYVCLALVLSRAQENTTLKWAHPGFVQVLQGAITIILYRSSALASPNTPYLLLGVVLLFSVGFMIYWVYDQTQISDHLALHKPQQPEKTKIAPDERTTTQLDQFVAPYNLSPREKEVLTLMVDGLDTEAICATLFISANTLKVHIRQLLRKTQSRNRRELLVRFFQNTTPNELMQTSSHEKIPSSS